MNHARALNPLFRAFLVCAVAAAPSAAQTTDHDQVRRAVLDYVEGFY